MDDPEFFKKGHTRVFKCRWCGRIVNQIPGEYGLCYGCELSVSRINRNANTVISGVKTIMDSSDNLEIDD